LGSSEESAPAQDNYGTNQETQKLEATTDIEVEISKLISFTDEKVTRVFSIA